MENKYANWNQADFEEMARKRNRRNLRIALVVGLVFISLIGSGIYAFFVSMKNSDAYKAAISAIAHDPAIQAQTGGIKDYTMNNASISDNNGNGTASFKITVSGKKADVEVQVLASKPEGSKWHVDELREEN